MDRPTVYLTRSTFWNDGKIEHGPWRVSEHDHGNVPAKPGEAGCQTEKLFPAETLRMVIAHSTGGHEPNAEDLDLNEICVRISQHHNRIFAMGQQEKPKK
jgi:hypothetical protein